MAVAAVCMAVAALAKGLERARLRLAGRLRRRVVERTLRLFLVARRGERLVARFFFVTLFLRRLAGRFATLRRLLFFV